MKGSIFTVLQDFEKLIYKVLMWIILLPKTIVQITLDPKWAPGYITDELDESNPANHGQVQFDEYMSPVILLLVVALLPALGFSLLPAFGTTLISSAGEKQTTDRFISFGSQTEFISSSTGLKYKHFWIVEQKQNDGGYKLLYDELHSDYSEKNYIEIVDNNTVKDKFLYTFNDPGEYLVTVLAYKYDPDRGEDLDSVERYSASIAVSVPLDVAESVVILDTNAKTESAPDTKTAVNFSERVTQEDTLFLALALMIPPLLFAFVTQIRSRTLRDIGENTLKESFYVQCYYFSPLSLAIWATYYARYFFTADVYGYQDFGISLVILLLPVLLAFLWFFRIEMQIMMDPQLDSPKTQEQAAAESQPPEKKHETGSLRAFLIVIGCLLLLGGGALLIFYFPRLQDLLRLSAIRLYPVGAIGLIAGFGYAWYKRRIAEHKSISLRNFGWVLAGSIMLIITFVVIRYKLYPPVQLSAPPETEVVVVPLSTATQVTLPPVASSTPEPPTPEPVESPTATLLPQNTDTSPSPEAQATLTPQPTETPVPATQTLEPQQYYTEDFNGDLVNWSEFMSSGEPNMVERHSEPGKYSVNLLQSEEKLARYYLINDNFTYADVKVEAVVINRGNNTNGVSLVCRYSDVGWYEFLISNSGTYSIYAVDRAGIVNSGYNQIDLGTSGLIKSGPGAVNVYAIACQGQELSLYINQELVDTITDVKFQFQEGKVGLGVSSPEKLPVKIEFDSFSVTKP